MVEGAANQIRHLVKEGPASGSLIDWCSLYIDSDLAKSCRAYNLH